jgi:hypothetical protein
MLFEAHITFDREHADVIQNRMLHAALRKWKFSKIDGDPLLGKKVYCYLTTHDKTEEDIQFKVRQAISVARELGFPPVRAKIEKIVYDERFTT